MTDQEVLDALNDEEALALTIFGEARGEPIEGKAAVASVVMNRAKTPARFSDSIKDVCLQPKQFSCWNVGDPNRQRLIALGERLKSGLTGSDTESRVLEECRFVAEGYLSGVLRSRIGDADHYLTRSLWSSRQRPTWATGTPEFVGNHVFMKVA